MFNINKIDPRILILFVFMFMATDLLSTSIALTFNQYAYESNKIANSFFNVGLLGIIMWEIIQFSVVFLFIYIFRFITHTLFNNIISVTATNYLLLVIAIIFFKVTFDNLLVALTPTNNILYEADING